MKEADPLPVSCEGSVILCKDDKCQGVTKKRTIHLKNRFGNIFANVVPKPGDTLAANDKFAIFSNKIHYSKPIDFSLDTQ